MPWTCKKSMETRQRWKHKKSRPRPKEGLDQAETLYKCDHLVCLVPSYHNGAGEHSARVEAVLSILKSIASLKLQITSFYWLYSTAFSLVLICTPFLTHVLSLLCLLTSSDWNVHKTRGTVLCCMFAYLCSLFLPLSLGLSLSLSLSLCLSLSLSLSLSFLRCNHCTSLVLSLTFCPPAMHASLLHPLNELLPIAKWS